MFSYYVIKSVFRESSRYCVSQFCVSPAFPESGLIKHISFFSIAHVIRDFLHVKYKSNNILCFYDIIFGDVMPRALADKLIRDVIFSDTYYNLKPHLLSLYMRFTYILTRPTYDIV